MLMHAVAGIDDGNFKVPRQQKRRTRGWMAHDNAIRSQSLKSFSGIHQRFTFFNAGGCSVDHRGVRAQQFCGELKRYAGAGGGFIEKKRNALAAKQRTWL